MRIVKVFPAILRDDLFHGSTTLNYKWIVIKGNIIWYKRNNSLQDVLLLENNQLLVETGLLC